MTLRWTEEERELAQQAFLVLMTLAKHTLIGLDIFEGEDEEMADQVYAQAVEIALDGHPDVRMELGRIWAMRQVIKAMRITADAIERMITADSTKDDGREV